uniref:Hypoxia up-regulated protein 1 n=1 Tax=Panagrolaimus davidi TaxID=227884 RepID=A0A914Q9J4_9BILA
MKALYLFVSFIHVTICKNYSVTDIAAYEKSVEDVAFDTFDGKNKEDIKHGTPRSIGNVKQTSTFVIQNPFEFPRQQRSNTSEPELSQFRASQRLLNPIEATNNNQQRIEQQQQEHRVVVQQRQPLHHHEVRMQHNSPHRYGHLNPGHMNYTGAYLIGSQTLRLYDLYALKPSSQWIDAESNKHASAWTVETLRERMTKVFNKIVKHELKCLILVNSTQLSIELLKLAYDIGQLYAKEVHIISATVARLQWAVAETKLNYLNIGGIVLIACFINDVCEFDELVVSSNSTYILNSVRKCVKDRAKDLLLERINVIRPASVAFVSTYECQALKRWFESQYPGRIHYIVEKPDYILLNGGLAKAATMFTGEYVPFDVKDFASGYKVEYIDAEGKKHSDALIPFNKSLPAKNTIELSNIKSFCVKYNEEITVAPVVPPVLAYGLPQSVALCPYTLANGVRITANINKSGVPYLKVDIQQTVTNIPPPSTSPPTAAAAVSHGLSALTMSTTTNRMMFNVNKVKFIIKLKANYGSIWSKNDGKEYPLLNVNQNDWTPFFVSFYKKDPKIGEKAEAHYKKSPQSVIKDVHKVIGIPFKKIEQDRKWKFEIVPAPTDDRIKYGMFEIETPEGKQKLSPDAIMSMFLVALKKLAERQFSIEIQKLSIQLSPQDYKPDQIKFVKAAAQNVGIEVENIDYMGF